MVPPPRLFVGSRTHQRAWGFVARQRWVLASRPRHRQTPGRFRHPWQKARPSGQAGCVAGVLCTGLARLPAPPTLCLPSRLQPPSAGQGRWCGTQISGETETQVTRCIVRRWGHKPLPAGMGGQQRFLGCTHGLSNTKPLRGSPAAFPWGCGFSLLAPGGRRGLLRSDRVVEGPRAGLREVP